MVEMLANNWEQFRGYFDALSEDEQTSILDHFEALDEDLVDVLFYEESKAEDVKRYVLSRPDAEQEAFIDAMDKALEQKLWEM
jgi:hypothetical protein